NTTTLPAANLRYLPLKTARGIVGVLGVVGPEQPQRHLTPEQRRLMDAFASQVAFALERAKLAEQARQAEVLQVTEKLQAALLNSVSHELRTPLVTITGSLSTLLADEDKLDVATQHSLIENAHEEAERLNRLVGNLLDMTRLEAGALAIHLQPCDVQDVIGAALNQMGNRLQGRSVQVNVPAGLPLVPLDFVPMVQVLVNLLDNALRYSPAQQPVEVSVRLKDRQIEVEVADRGMGIPSADLEHIFDRFYRLQRPGEAGGTGLGLSICRGIVEAHSGSIRAHNRPGGGASFIITLPLGASADG
ncbi:MAG TPA: ATP-binding protein, partial [Anaerolineae bacterium]|nr:ATP-binding protein [Anaerolineae bacterium]